jgi:hypothetical protein
MKCRTTQPWQPSSPRLKRGKSNVLHRRNSITSRTTEEANKVVVVVLARVAADGNSSHLRGRANETTTVRRLPLLVETEAMAAVMAVGIARGRDGGEARRSRYRTLPGAVVAAAEEEMLRAEFLVMETKRIRKRKRQTLDCRVP